MTADPAATADRVLNLFNSAGQAEYHGEQVSQLEHALQAAHLAGEDDGDDQEIIAALLHDIGHIWPVEGRQVTSVGVVEHDEVGAHRLGAQALRELGFSDDIADIVSGHVAAKRYLVATDEAYAAKLSDVSVESLRLQGGPMSAEEVQDFERSPNWQSKVRVRTWDDRAKTPGADVPSLESYREMITAHLSRQQAGN